MALEAVGSNPIIHPIESGVRETSDPVFLLSFAVRRRYNGLSPSGKAPDFDSDIRRFESCQPSQFDPVAQPAEHLPFKQGVRGSNPRWITRKCSPSKMGCIFLRLNRIRSPRTPKREAFFERSGETADAGSKAAASGVRIPAGSPRRRGLRVVPR